MPPAVPAANFDAAAAINRVGLDLYRELAAADEGGANLVLSPYSIESALALAYVGADGDTRAEMARTLHLPPEDAAVQSGFEVIRAGLAHAAQRSRAQAESFQRAGRAGEGIEWRVANRLYGERDFAFRDSFLALMKDGFGAPLERVDFRTAHEAARRAMNAWVEEQTKNKIRDLIPANGVGPSTGLVLINALYLKAPWANPFFEHATAPEFFRISANEKRKVPTMHRTGSLGYVAEHGATVVVLPYHGEELQFLVMLPDEDRTPDALARELTPALLARWSNLESRTQVQLALPKFRVEGNTIALGGALRTLGMQRAFDSPRGSANFERIAPRKPDDYLAISEVYHQTFIALDEAGTEAAAATAVAMVRAAGFARSPAPIEVRIDRPFLFAIQHRASGACLFLGRIGDPR